MCQDPDSDDATTGIDNPNHRLRFWALVGTDKEVAIETGERMPFIAVAFPDILKSLPSALPRGDVVPVSGRNHSRRTHGFFQLLIGVLGGEPPLE